MDFIWGGDREEVNQERIFSLKLKEKGTRIEICAVDNYQVYLDGTFNSYGPERTAAGFSRKKIVNIEGGRVN